MKYVNTLLTLRLYEYMNRHINPALILKSEENFLTKHIRKQMQKS